LEFVWEFKWIKFYDDAIATIPEATIEAIKALPQTETIFLWWLDRGYDFYDLINFINKTKIRNIVLFPDSWIKIENTLKELKFLEKYNILHTKDMKEAVQFAYAYTNPWKICLLSTASPSYSIWSDFIEKWKIFQEWVLKLWKKEKTA
jgi:UDP-N-acetylmuramoylalanine--D-glutamate ligase